MRNLTPKEEATIQFLVKAFNSFLSLDDLHPNDKIEFTQAIRQAQNIVLARPALDYLTEARDEE